MESIALREWAVAVDALEEGRQVIVLRKGGISEETKEFRLESPRFFLFPSYEHQRPELVKPEARETVTKTQAAFAANPDLITLTSFAEVTEDIEVTDADTLKRLEGLHVWTEDYAEERLKWKKTKPLHVLVLRIYKLASPIELRMHESFAGCRSWIRIDGIEAGPMNPVLGDERFASSVEAVKRQIEQR